MSDKPMAYWDDDLSVWVYRASSIYSCSKALIAARMGVEGDEPPESMQLRFADGHLHEPAIIASIEKQTGWKQQPSGSQETIEIDVIPGEVIIRGHVDGIGHNPAFNPDLRVLEAKALADSGYKTWLSQGFNAFPYYRDQLTVYMAALDMPAVFAVKNKNSGVVDVKMIDDQPGDLEAILERVRQIEYQAREDELPGPCDRRMFPCPFWRLHEDEDDVAEAQAAVTGSVKDADSLDHWLNEYDVAREDEKEAKERKDEAKAALMTILEEEGADKLEGSGFNVTKKPHTFRWLDEADMEADGIDTEFYRREKISYYPLVKRKGKKK